MHCKPVPITLAIVLANAGSALSLGCTWETGLPDDAAAIPVASNRELVVTDESPALAALSRNDESGPLSFREASARIGLDQAGVLRWLDAWAARLRTEGHPERATLFEERVTCAWLAHAPENACDPACAACSSRTLPLAAAPFRLVAVTNRTDLSALPDRAADGGEGRLVFALMDGPADDASSSPLPMTVIFEYAQPGTALEWAKRWHALGAASEEDFPRALTELTRAFVEPGTLAQVRTADTLTGPMTLHQFERDAGDLIATNVRNTPAWSQVNEESIRDYAREHAAELADGTALLPKEWWDSSSSIGAEPGWVADLPAHEDLVRATCGGCHARAERGFQIDPLAHGRDRLSRFLVDPANGPDEVGRRADWMKLTLYRAGGRR